MGWGNCGTDSKGRPIGYCHEATCDYPGCNEKIDRGLAYACGGMHGNQTLPVCDGVEPCEGYFCGKHLITIEIGEEEDHSNPVFSLCPDCHEKHKHLDPDEREYAEFLKDEKDG